MEGLGDTVVVEALRRVRSDFEDASVEEISEALGQLNEQQLAGLVDLCALHTDRRARIQPAERAEATPFVDVIAKRYDREKAIIVTSNKSWGAWGEILADQVMTAAILDRLLHRFVTVNIQGESYRLRPHRRAELTPPNLDPERRRTRRIPAMSRREVSNSHRRLCRTRNQPRHGWMPWATPPRSNACTRSTKRRADPLATNPAFSGGSCAGMPLPAPKSLSSADLRLRRKDPVRPPRDPHICAERLKCLTNPRRRPRPARAPEATLLCQENSRRFSHTSGIIRADQP